MRLKTEVEELKREQKKKQTIEPKGAMSDAAAADVAAPALTSGVGVYTYRSIWAQKRPGIGGCGRA